MAKTSPVSIQKLTLDLRNFRTTVQADEIQAVRAMVSISPDHFWALMDSLIEDGYLPTENILVLEPESIDSELVVKEGNRRIGALKVIYGYLPASQIGLPPGMSQKIGKLSNAWKEANEDVPCAIYSANEFSIVDRIVTLAHGKGEKAGRDQWNAVARSRHNREANSASEPGLNLLERYLENGKNFTKQQAERWAGDYPISVLDEAIKKIAPRFETSSASNLAKKYPSIPYRDSLEEIVKYIGLQSIRFETIRGQEDFAAEYGVPPVQGSASRSESSARADAASSPAAPLVRSEHYSENATDVKASPNSGHEANHTPPDEAQPTPLKKKIAAVAIDDPRSVRRLLKKLVPRGNNRQKVVTLRDEALNLKLERNPIAFCFLIRSMFEIAAKAYCEDHKSAGGPVCKKSNGEDKPLVAILNEITSHLTQNSADKAMLKSLHGAMTELGRPDGILSVTSMNQLVHSPSFSVAARDIARLFANIFHLLDAISQ